MEHDADRRDRDTLTTIEAARGEFEQTVAELTGIDWGDISVDVVIYKADGLAKAAERLDWCPMAHSNTHWYQTRGRAIDGKVVLHYDPQEETDG